MNELTTDDLKQRLAAAEAALQKLADAETALRASEQRYKTQNAELLAVLESMPDAVYIGNADGISLCNQAALDQLGYATPEELNRNIGTLSHEIDNRDPETGLSIQEEDLSMSRALRGEKAVAEVLVRHRGTGEEKVLRSAASPIMLDGRLIGAVAVNTDITEQKKAETILRTESSLLAGQDLLLRFSDTIRPLNDPDTIATTATRLLFDYFRVDRCFISRLNLEQGKAWLEHEQRRSDLPSIEGEINLADFPDAMRMLETQSLVIRDTQTDPELSPRDRAAIAGLNAGGLVAAMLRQGERKGFWDIVIVSEKPRNWLASDVRILEEIAERTWAAMERAKIEKALLQTEKLAAVGRLASSIAHEINNPLEAVINLHYLMDQIELPAEAKHYLHLAQSELSRVNQITLETLRFSRRNTNAVHVRISTLCESVLNLHEARIKGANITVDRRYKDHADLLCFPNELRQVFANLIGNAIDSMIGLPDARLCVRTRNARDPQTGRNGIRILVADTGVGMTHATLLRIWDPFFTTKGDTGTGLGLWVSREIIGKHGGSVCVRSRTAIPSGTTFSLFFPDSL